MRNCIKDGCSLWFSVAIATLPTISFAQPAVPPPVVITEPTAVLAAEGLFQDVQALAALVTPCVQSGQGKPGDCICRFPKQLAQVQRSARWVLAQYPDWQNKLVNWNDPSSKQSRTISLDAVLRQSSPQCPAK
jgi:hypothetical protein